MLYPARWKKITVDQSTVLKNRLFCLFVLGGGGGAPGIVAFLQKCQNCNVPAAFPQQIIWQGALVSAFCNEISIAVKNWAYVA